MFQTGDHHSNVSTFCSASLITESFYIQWFDLYLKAGCKMIWWPSFDQNGNWRAQWWFPWHKCLLSVCYVSSTERLVRLLVQYDCGSETFERSNVPYHGAESKRAAVRLPCHASRCVLDKSYSTGNVPANKAVRQRSSRGTHPCTPLTIAVFLVIQWR